MLSKNLNVLNVFNTDEIINLCRDNKIPTEIIELSLLKNDLGKLDKLLIQHNHELVIKPNKVFTS